MIPLLSQILTIQVISSHPQAMPRINYMIQKVEALKIGLEMLGVLDHWNTVQLEN